LLRSFWQFEPSGQPAVPHPIPVKLEIVKRTPPAQRAKESNARILDMPYLGACFFSIVIFPLRRALETPWRSPLPLF
jgi:hypothetical protein